MSLVKEAITQEIAERVEKSKEYYNKYTTAKTNIKKKTYKKKLTENNNVLADLLIALDKLDNSQYNSPNNDKNGLGDVEHNATEQD